MGEKKAFTLIEMLIVIAIIAILAVLAVDAYGGARRSAQIDLATDGLVSALKYQQSLSKSGKVEDEADASVGAPAVKKVAESKCYGMYFSKNPDEGKAKVMYAEAPYYAVKGEKADWCDLEAMELRKYETEADFELFMINRFRPDDDADELLVLFKPPFARVVTGDMNGVASPGLQMTPYINFGLRLPDGTNEKYFRLDTSTGLTERFYGEQI